MAREIDGEFIIFDIENGMLYKLNETAALIWHSLTKPSTVHDVAEKIAKRYSKKLDEVKGDVDVFLDEYQSIFFLEKN